MTQEPGAHIASNSQLVQPPATGAHQRLEPPTDTGHGLHHHRGVPGKSGIPQTMPLDDETPVYRFFIMHTQLFYWAAQILHRVFEVSIWQGSNFSSHTRKMRVK